MVVEDFQTAGCCHHGDGMDDCGGTGVALLGSHRTLRLVGEGTVGDRRGMLTQRQKEWWMRCPVAESWVLLAQMKKSEWTRYWMSKEVGEVMDRVESYSGDCMMGYALVLSHRGMALQERATGHHSVCWWRWH